MKKLTWVPVLAVLVASCPGRDERPGIPAKHLLLVTVAGLRADHTSAWQYQRPTTYTEIDGGLRRSGRALALDDLAAEGVMFAHTFAPSGDTGFALASLHTGRSPLESGGQPGETHATLAESLGGAGFATAAFVTEGSLTGDSWRRGFDVFERGAKDRDTLGLALDWAGARDFGNGQSVFLWVHLEGPTFPFEPSEMDATIERGGLVDFSRLFTDPDYAGPADGSAAYRARALEPDALPLTAADHDHIVDLYDGEVAQTDRLVQLFLDFYRYAGAADELWERTFLVVAGASGLELFEAGAADPRSWGEAGRLSDAVLKVPLVLRHPDSLTGRRIFAHVTELQDLFPTLLEWGGGASVAGPGAARGRSLLRVTDKGGRGFERQPAFACRVAGGRVEALTVRDDRWRLIWTPGAEPAFELIDQVADPLALDDVSEEYPDVVQGLLQELRVWLESHAATGVDVAAFVGG